MLAKKSAQKVKLFMKDFFSKCDQIRKKLWIWSHLLKKYLIENFFCAVKMAQEEFSFNEVTGWMVLMFVRVHSFINVFLRSPWPFHIWCWKMTKLTLKICSVNTARFLKYISPFFNIMQGRLRFSENVF